jgi:hypothetical protein
VAEFRRRYRTVMTPTPPVMPRHKGMVEGGVKHGHNNAIKTAVHECGSVKENRTDFERIFQAIKREGSCIL